jgi:lipoate-protein ligase A
VKVTGTGRRSFRFLYSGKNDGPTNMAIDEAVMNGLRDGRSLPLLRIYAWDPPTITIGYFQHARDIDRERVRKSGFNLVRRLTGGRAVLHHEELTYSILFTADDFEPFRKKEIFRFIARCLMDSLALLGIRSEMATKSRGDARSANCFASPAQYEIESPDFGKLIGSAQVISKGVMLQHGAIPLTDSYAAILDYLTCDSPFQKENTSLNALAPSPVTEEDLLKALKRGFQDHLDLVDAVLTERELTDARELVENKYGRDEWNLRL